MWDLQGHSLKGILATLALFRASEVISQERKRSSTTLLTNLFLLITELSSYNSFISIATRYYYTISVIEYAQLK